MSTSRGIESLPLSGVLPSRDGVVHVATRTLVVFAAWLAVSLLNGTRRWQGEEPLPVATELVYNVAATLEGSMMYAMLACPLVLMLLLDLSPVRRFTAAAAASMPIVGFFEAASSLTSAIKYAYDPYPRTPNPDVMYFASEAWGGFVDGATGTLLFAFLIALPFLALLVVSDRYAGTTLLEPRGDR